MVALAAIGASAQTMYDALNFSETDWYGTARSIAMGNAMTAVGGDLGGIAINPAGSAVTGYSLFAITPGLSISSNTSQFTQGVQSSSVLKNGQTKFILPSCGFILDFDFGDSSGLCNWTFGFTANASNYYNNGTVGRGVNAGSCLSGLLAVNATNNAYKWSSLTGYTADYPTSVAYNSCSIDPLNTDSTGEFVDDGNFIGIQENYTAGKEPTLGGAINEKYNEETYGHKADYLINFGFNIANTVYIGTNLGLQSISYTKGYSIYESALDPSVFQTGFNDLRYAYSYKAEGTGVYGKIGVIVTPGSGLRLGATFQTPTVISIKERYCHSMSNSYYTSGRLATNDPVNSPEGTFRYKITTPMSFSLGVAYTLGSVGVISVDYERVNYSRMKLSSYNSNFSVDFDAENDDIKEFMGASNMLRAGLEVRLKETLAIRAGYNFTSGAERRYGSTGTLERVKADINAFSLGLGYDSDGSFFADLCGRLTMRSDEDILLYDNYLSDALSPSLNVKRNLFTIAATIGWRF